LLRRARGRCRGIRRDPTAGKSPFALRKRQERKNQRRGGKKLAIIYRLLSGFGEKVLARARARASAQSIRRASHSRGDHLAAAAVTVVVGGGHVEAPFVFLVFILSHGMQFLQQPRPARSKSYIYNLHSGT
jgi:hypothetical protein